MSAREFDNVPVGQVSGAGMDRVVPVGRWGRRVRIAVIGAGCVALAVVAWLAVPKGVTVKAADLTIATAAFATFRDELIVRASVAPLDSVVLDAVEGGRVEQVIASDGALVRKGEILFRLSNLELEQQLLARSADTAQQLANLATQRAELAGSRASYRREVAGLEFDLDRQAKTHQRNVELAAQDFISGSALEESADRLAQQKRLLDQARVDGRAELDTREESVKQMESAMTGLSAGLKLLRGASDGLSVQAPTDGRLTGFHLQVGQSVKQADRVGRIDSPDRFKLNASIDEFYLNRMARGLHGSVMLQGLTQALTLHRLNPEVKEGRFMSELLFDTQPPAGALQSGQGVDARITLGQPSKALILAGGDFYADTGGQWVFVLNKSGDTAVRRSVRLGRRAAGQVEVLDGLKDGESVIVSGYKRFGDATSLNVTH